MTPSVGPVASHRPQKVLAKGKKATMSCGVAPCRACLPVSDLSPRGLAAWHGLLGYSAVLVVSCARKKARQAVQCILLPAPPAPPERRPAAPRSAPLGVEIQNRCRRAMLHPQLQYNHTPNKLHQLVLLCTKYRHGQRSCMSSERNAARPGLAMHQCTFGAS